MEGTRIFKLQGPVKVTASFEEAFGDYSEARGKGRARRAERRAARRANKMERISSRGEARAARRANKQAAVEDRQTRRQTRVSGRIGRRQLRDEFRKSREEQETPETQETQETPETVNPTPDTGGTGFGVSDGTAYTNDSQGGGGGYMPSEPQGEEQQPGEGEYETTQDSDVDDSGSGEDEEGSSADGINYEDLGPVDDIVTLEPDDFYTYEDGSASADGTPTMVRVRIGKGPKDAAMKCEWNKEIVSRLKNKLALIDAKLSQGVSANQAAALGAKRAKINEAIVLHTDRAQQFDGMLSDYSNADDYSEATGRKPKKTVKKKRKAEVKAAKREARKARIRAKKQAQSAKRMSKKGLSGDSVIPVDEQLKPEFDTQRIVVPASELTTGYDGETGLIALDSSEDFDSPTEYTYSSADGLKNVNWKGVLIGVAVAGLAIWGAKKAKLF